METHRKHHKKQKEKKKEKLKYHPLVFLSWLTNAG